MGGTAAWRGHRPQGPFHHRPGLPETPVEGPGAGDSQVPTLGQEAGFRDAPGAARSHVVQQSPC